MPTGPCELHCRDQKVHWNDLKILSCSVSGHFSNLNWDATEWLQTRAAYGTLILENEFKYKHAAVSLGSFFTVCSDFHLNSRIRFPGQRFSFIFLLLYLPEFSRPFLAVLRPCGGWGMRNTNLGGSKGLVVLYTSPLLVLCSFSAGCIWKKLLLTVLPSAIKATILSPEVSKCLVTSHVYCCRSSVFNECTGKDATQLWDACFP